ncbi:uncharacterized protein BDR25DRAFT_18609 [Lindgomyces ingoldianus]|uniref:Uncharacterized protein n=1 Tax=Lindgomyces ingoldianus TaxID=673940 RepID=A0ACB6R1C5_9PLEO|nr:uncharacterized protein BDR25DRAFT_18609 [Lindgomyces ingoldianus]KAF2472130.1 hypothetical protein BDR25DRAFT_18609 [Lindgomyces ingoldianus]
MDQFGSQMRSFANSNGEPAAQQRQSNPPANAKPAAEAPPKQHHNGCADVKPRLTKEQHDILEAHFQQQHKPSTSVKKGFAESLGVPIDKINNWFQNRRAKVKQDLKKQLNQYNMGMGIYGPPQIPIVTSRFPPHTEQHQQQHHQQQQHQPQPQPPMAPEFYPVNADISPTCLPVESVEGPSALDLGSQISLHQPFDMHPLRSIPETDRAMSYNASALMHSFMAATAGASYMQHNAASLPPQQSGFSYDNTGLPRDFPNDLAFSMPTTLPNEPAPCNDPLNGFSDFSGLDYSSAELQNSTGTLSSEPSPFSGAQSTGTTHSSTGPNASSVASLASVYSGWTDEQNSGPDIKLASAGDDAFDEPYNMPQASASEHTLPFWGPNGQGQSFSQADMYQHANASAHAILSSPGQAEDRKLSTSHSDFDPPSAFADDAYSRRNSSTTNLANTIETIHIQNGHTPDGFKQPNQPSSIAARRHKRPTALNPSTLRSSSYTNGMPSPGGNNDHTLRRIRSSGIPSSAGRIQKPAPGSAQRSPMALTFAEAAASPKFQRTFSASSTAIVGQGGSLAPPTPSTPNEMGRFPYWQSNTVIRSHPPMPEHSSPESLNVPWSVEPQPAGLYSSNTASPPSTPLDVAQINQARFANDNLYRDTPPQSAPATQQSFPRSFMHPPQMRAGFHSTSDLTIVQPKPSHFRRPSLPDGGHPHSDVPQVSYTDNFGDFQLNYDQQFKDINLNGIHHNVPFAPPVTMPEFLVHEYNPQGSAPGPILRRVTEPQPKSYIFANQGPRDFRS